MQKSTFNLLLETFFPRHCLYCSKLIPVKRTETYLCEDCFELIPYNTVSRCAFCPKSVVLWQTCRACATSHDIDRLLVATDYQDPIIEGMIKALKYRFVREVANDIGGIMAKYLLNHAGLLNLDLGDCALTYVPLHPLRLRWRGFNQAELIAKIISAKSGIPLIENLIKRSKYKKPQADVPDRDERVKNAENIFDLAVRPLPRKTIILIDDVATTSSTLDNAAKVIKSLGFKKVIGFVFARG